MSAWPPSGVRSAKSEDAATHLPDDVQAADHLHRVVHDHEPLELEGLAVLHESRAQAEHEVEVRSDQQEHGAQPAHHEPFRRARVWGRENSPLSSEVAAQG